MMAMFAICSVSLGAHDVPELVDHDPFEDEVANEIVLLDAIHADAVDQEVVS